MTSKNINYLYACGIFLLFNSLSFIFVLLPKIDSLLQIQDGVVSHLSDMLSLILLAIFVIALFAAIIAQFIFAPQLVIASYLAAMSACLIALFGGIYADIGFLYSLAEQEDNYRLFFENIKNYIEQSSGFYLIILLLMVGLSVLFKNGFKTTFEKISDRLIRGVFVIGAVFLPFVTIVPLPIIAIQLFQFFSDDEYKPIPSVLLLGQNLAYVGFSLILLVVAYRIRKKTKEQLSFMLKMANAVGVFSGFAMVFELFALIYPYKLLANMGHIDGRRILYYGGSDIKNNLAALGLLLVFTLVVSLFRQHIKRVQFDDLHNEDNAGVEHGGAKWASHENIKNYGFYNAVGKVYAAQDENGERMYFPLANRTVLAPPGGGKTTSVAIPLGLLYNGPMLILDYKGEIWSVVARHRFEVFDRKQIAIDPFNILQQAEFQYKADLTRKPEELLTKYRLNPFHLIPEDPDSRQRVLSAFASSFIVREDNGGASAHFYDNAETLIKGMIDYVLKTVPYELQNFEALLMLTRTPLDELPDLLQSMIECEGEAANAGGTLSKLGADERGSLFSTTGRQLAWLTDVNMQDCLSFSNFDIEEIITGTADIYIVLPADTARTHGRLIRMIIALIRGSLIRLRPSELPEKKIVFLLDELAQLGKCPDIEQAIEIFRSYGLIVVSIFQFLSQIEEFNKPDVFTNATILQFFTNKDNDTMKFIQEKFSKTTILQKTLSNNKGDQKQKNQVWGGSVSVGEGESVQSGGVDLVHFDQIREMPKDEQWFLVDNNRPIRAKKLPYYQDDYFADCHYDPNPIEDRAFARKVAAHVATLAVKANEIVGKKDQSSDSVTENLSAVVVGVANHEPVSESIPVVTADEAKVASVAIASPEPVVKKPELVAEESKVDIMPQISEEKNLSTDVMDNPGMSAEYPEIEELNKNDFEEMDDAQ